MVDYPAFSAINVRSRTKAIDEQSEAIRGSNCPRPPTRGIVRGMPRQILSHIHIFNLRSALEPNDMAALNQIEPETQPRERR
jgi:hypothetical protein